MMGKRGPQRTPTSILRARGSRKAKARENEPQPKETPLSCPKWLSESGRAEWKRVVGELRRLKLLSILDVAVLASYCEAYSGYVAVTQQLQSEEVGSVEWHRCLRSQSRALRDVLRSQQELGMSPASRSGVATLSEGSFPGDELERFLAGKSCLRMVN